MIYLDHAATSFQKPPVVLKAVQNAMETCASIGRSGHKLSMAAAEIAFEARKVAGTLFDTPPDRVVFTANATHGLNIAIRSLVSPGERVLVSGFEHNAVMRPLYHLGADILIAGRNMFNPADTLFEFENGLRSGVKAVICTHVSNVFGYILPISQIAKLCISHQVPFILDASQSAGVLPVSLRDLQAAFVVMPGHKSLYGPQGTGLLLCGREPLPLLYGGTGSNSRDYTMPTFLPDMLEAGTHNVPGIAGLLAGMQYVQKTGISHIYQKENRLLGMLKDILKLFPQIKYYSTDSECQTGVISWNVRNKDCETVAEVLADRGVAVRAGLHCSPLAHESAGTLNSGTVRISVSDLTTEDDLTTFSSILSSMMEHEFIPDCTCQF